MNKLAQSLSVFVALLALTESASAATLVVNCNVVTTPTELSQSSTCPQFNIGGATLQSVQITVSGTLSGQLGLTNNATTSQTGSATTQSQFNVGALAGFTFVNPVFTASFGTGSQTVNSGQTITFAGLTGNGSGSVGTNTTSLGGYTGAGNFLIPVSTLSDYSFLLGGGNFASSQATAASATAVVTYTYLPAGTHTLTVSKNGSGSGTVTGTGINCGIVCTTTGTGVLPLTATSNSGSGFVGWSGACTGTGACAPDLSVADQAVTATFDVLPAAGIPTLSEWGLLVLTVLLGLAAFACLRRRLRKSGFG